VGKYDGDHMEIELNCFGSCHSFISSLKKEKSMKKMEKVSNKKKLKIFKIQKEL